MLVALMQTLIQQQAESQRNNEQMFRHMATQQAELLVALRCPTPVAVGTPAAGPNRAAPEADAQPQAQPAQALAPHAAGAPAGGAALFFGWCALSFHW